MDIDFSITPDTQVVLLLCSTLLGFCGAFLLMRYPGHACCGQHCLFCGVLNAVDVLLHHGPFAVTAAALIAVLLAAVIGRGNSVFRHNDRRVVRVHL